MFDITRSNKSQPSSLPKAENRTVLRAMNTPGDGNCGIHALLGITNSEGDCFYSQCT